MFTNIIIWYILSGQDIQPYLQPLMEHLLGVLKVQTTSVKQKQLAISAIGATGKLCIQSTL